MITEQSKSGVVLSEEEEQKLIDGINANVWDGVWKGNWPHLFTQAVDARDRAERIGYKRGFARALLNIGQLYRLQSEPEKAEPAFLEALALLEEANDEVGLGSVWHQVGLLSMHRGLYERAIEAFLQAREIWSRIGDKERLATSYTAVGNLYASLEQFDSAEEQYETALALHKECNDERGRARVLSNYARVAHGRGNYEVALEIQREAAEKLQALDQPMNVAATYLNLGSTYCRLEQYDQSIAVLTAALEVADENKYRRAQFIGRVYLAETYMCMGDAITARKYYDETDEFAWYADLGDVAPVRIEVHAQICAGEGDYQKAYELECESIRNRKEVSSAQVQHAVATKSAHLKFEQALKEKAALTERNQELQKLNQHKDEMLRIVSHDMRNPLGFIIGMGNLLKTEPEDHVDSVQQIGELIEDTGQRLLVLVNNLLNAARLEDGALKLEKQSTSIAAILSESEKLFQPLAKNKNISLSFTTSFAEGNVNVDEPKLQQVVSNILSNAVKFTPSGGRIDVNAMRHHGTVTIAIRDSGIGMSKEQIDDLFMKYSPLRRSGTNGEKGFGLGMTIIKQFVELHGGSVTVSSTVNRGTTISITIPDL